MSELAGLSSARTQRRRGKSRALDSWVLGRLRSALEGAPIQIRLWDGTRVACSDGPVEFSVEIHDRATLLGLAWDREVAFGEAFSSGRLEVRGDLTRFLACLYRCFPRPSGRVRGDEGAGARRNTRRRAKENIHQHYDLGNDFYSSWLDRQLVYTCAYFPDPELTLEAAQLAKMEHVCRKLALRPDERVVEAGCGWGGLALYMAREYGVHVTAYNVSHEQIRHARERARSEGLTERVEFVEDDYRAIDGRYDAFVSVGMLEHVGLREFASLAKVIQRSLDPKRGRGLLHFIGRDYPFPLNAWIRKHIFPGAYPPTLAQVTERVLAPGRFTVLDIENLRGHYAMTLGHWLSRFECSVKRGEVGFGESFVRAWRLYLAGSQAAFETGIMQLFQVVFTRSSNSDVPWIGRRFGP